MSTQVIRKGIYAGILYVVTMKDEKLYIGLDGDVAVEFAHRGANLKLLDDIGSQDPDEVMAAMFETLGPTI